MRLELYDEKALLFHSEEKDVILVQHMIKNLYYVKKVIRTIKDQHLYEELQLHPHEHLANIQEYGIVYDKTIIIEEFVNGCTLEYLLSQRPLTLSEITSILEQVFSVVAHLHQLNPAIIHRDIKPENILIDELNVYLIDFEIAKRFIKKERDKQRFGSVGYAAPEQYNGYSDHRSDIYAIGKLMKEMLIQSRVEPVLYANMLKVIDMATVDEITQRFQRVEDFQRETMRILKKYEKYANSIPNVTDIKL